MVRDTGIEPVTSSVSGKRSPAELIATSGSDRHPILRPSSNAAAEVPGTVFSITAEQLAAADAYEVDDYQRVSVPLRSGATAWVYVFAG